VLVMGGTVGGVWGGKGGGSYGRIKEPAADAEPDPGVDRETQAEGQGDVGQSVELVGVVRVGGRVGDLGAGEGGEEEEEGADEFAAAGYEVVPGGVVQAVGEGESTGAALGLFHFLGLDFGEWVGWKEMMEVTCVGMGGECASKLEDVELIDYILPEEKQC